MYDPTKDQPLTLPQAFDSKPDCTLDQFKAAVDQVGDGNALHDCHDESGN